MRKLNVAGKQIPAILIALLLCAGIGSATVLSYYGKIQGTVTVQQPVLVDGNTYDILIAETFGDIYGGDVISTSHYLDNKANMPITVELSTPQKDGIVTTYTNTLHLESKDAEWATDGRMKADLAYNIVGDRFVYSLAASGLQANTEYSLIYYADRQDRMLNWGGDNPGALIATGASDIDGNLKASGSKNVGDMPAPGDWNNNPPATEDYCDSHNKHDDYDHCTGAKIWLVPSVDYNSDDKKLTAWNPSTYLFETDLVRYFDNIENKVTLPPGRVGETNTLNFSITYEFPIDVTGTYTMTTSVIPVA